MVSSEWVLSIMLAVLPSAPHRKTYERTSEAIARASTANPLFMGDYGDAKTAALIVATARYESELQPDVEGDCTKGGVNVKCTVPGAIPHSFCLLQVNESNFKGFGITRELVQTDIDVCVTTGLKMMHQSFTVCRALPLEERLRWYAAGPVWATSVDAANKSRHRVAKGLWLFKEVTPTW